MVANGGGETYIVTVNTGYLKKNTCYGVAERFVKLTGMTQMRIAKEIYAHAVMYYASSSLISVYKSKIAKETGESPSKIYTNLMWIKEHANPIHLGNDSLFREVVYNAIWTL